jgi:hypothetical protein
MARHVRPELLLSLAEAGWFLQLPEHTVRRLCAIGRLPGERPARNWQLRASDLEPLLGGIGRRRLDQVRRGELSIPTPDRRSGRPAPLTTSA